MSNSQLAVAQTYTVQTNGNSTAGKAKKPSHGSHSIPIVITLLQITAIPSHTYNMFGARLNLPENLNVFTVCHNNIVIFLPIYDRM